jgi:purine nucleosidase
MGGKKYSPCACFKGCKWRERPDNNRKIVVWENFDKAIIMHNFYDRMKNHLLLKPYYFS